MRWLWELERDQKRDEFVTARIGAYQRRYSGDFAAKKRVSASEAPLWPRLSFPWSRTPRRSRDKNDNDMDVVVVKEEPESKKASRIAVNSWTEDAIRLEVMGSKLPTTVYDMIVAVSESESVLYHHSTSIATNCDDVLLEDDDSGLYSRDARGQLQDGRESRKQALHSALTSLLTMEPNDSVLDRKVQSWDDAKEILSRVLIFRSEQVQDVEMKDDGTDEVDGSDGTETTATDSTTTAATTQQKRSRSRALARAKSPPHGVPSPMRRGVKRFGGVMTREEAQASRLLRKSASTCNHTTRWTSPSVKEYLDRIIRAASQIRGMAPPQMKWRQIALTPTPTTPPLLTETAADKALEESIQELKKETAPKEEDGLSKEELDTILTEREERQEREEKEAQAREIARALLRPLTEDEKEIVRKALYSDGMDEEVLARSDTGDSVQRRTMETLRPGRWVNDEVIHFFLYTLSKRDTELCEAQPERKRCHFFMSFFITKLYDEGSSGEYKYANVKRWSKKVPGKDIFGLDKVFFPVNLANTHWACAVADIPQRRIQFYDSMHGSGRYYLDGIWRYLQDEHKAKKGTPLPDADAWTLVECTPDTPLQANGVDCGVFTCMFADFLSKDCPLSFSQEHIPQCRERIALSIMKGRAIM